MEAFAEQFGTAGLFCRVPVPRRTGSEPVPPRGHRHRAGHKTSTRTSTRGEKKAREAQEVGEGDRESTRVPTASGESLLAASSLVLNQVDTIAPYVERELHHPRGAAHRERSGERGAAPPMGRGTHRQIKSHRSTSVLGNNTKSQTTKTSRWSEGRAGSLKDEPVVINTSW